MSAFADEWTSMTFPADSPPWVGAVFEDVDGPSSVVTAVRPDPAIEGGWQVRLAPVNDAGERPDADDVAHFEAFVAAHAESSERADRRHARRAVVAVSALETEARKLATERHAGQVRKYTGEPYIEHPAAVVAILRTVTSDPETLAAAWCHDLLEDTRSCWSDIRLALSREVADLVLEVTDASRPSDGNRATRKAIDREHLAKSSPRGATIKLADIIDNRSSIVEHDPKFAAVYLEEARQLLPLLRHGDPTLWAQADALINSLARFDARIDAALAPIRDLDADLHPAVGSIITLSVPIIDFDGEELPAGLDLVVQDDPDQETGAILVSGDGDRGEVDAVVRPGEWYQRPEEVREVTVDEGRALPDGFFEEAEDWLAEAEEERILRRLDGAPVVRPPASPLGKMLVDLGASVGPFGPPPDPAESSTLRPFWSVLQVAARRHPSLERLWRPALLLALMLASMLALWPARVMGQPLTPEEREKMEAAALLDATFCDRHPLAKSCLPNREPYHRPRWATRACRSTGAPR